MCEKATRRASDTFRAKINEVLSGDRADHVPVPRSEWALSTIAHELCNLIDSLHDLSNKVQPLMLQVDAFEKCQGCKDALAKRGKVE